MNDSSSAKAGLYQTPESKNILQSLNDLKREVCKFGSTHPDKLAYNRLVKNVDDLEVSLKNQHKELTAMERILETSQERRLTDKQRIMIKIVAELEGNALYTKLIERISAELSIPKSTVRWNLKGLRDAGFIAAGDRNNKGIPVRLTEMGQILLGVV